MNLHSINSWTCLAKAHADAILPGQESESAPLGFSTRVAACWKDLSRSERFQFWRVWSLRASLAALILFALATAFQPAAQASTAPVSAVPLALPTLTIPLP